MSAPVAKVEQTVVTTEASFHGEVIKRASRILKRKPTAHKKGKLTHFFLRVSYSPQIVNSTHLRYVPFMSFKDMAHREIK